MNMEGVAAFLFLFLLLSSSLFVAPVAAAKEKQQKPPSSASSSETTKASSSSSSKSSSNEKEVYVGTSLISKTYRQCMHDGSDAPSNTDTSTAALNPTTTTGHFHCIKDDPVGARDHFDKQTFKPPPPDGLYNMGIPQRVDGSDAEKKSIQKVIQQMVDYFYQEVLTKPEYDGARHQCANHYELCAFWAAVGECENNRQFMIPNCAAACRFCLLHRVAMGRPASIG